MNDRSNFLEVFETLNELRPSIINTWEKKLRLHLKSAQDKPRLVLVHYLPSILENLTKFFQNRGLWDEINEHDTIALNKTHGEQRANEANFSLEELLIEFSLLRETIIEHLYPLVTPELEAAKIIHRFLDRSVQSTVSEFERLQNQKISSQRDNLEIEKSLRQRFIVALTHDLRTPLTAAIMSAEMVQRKSETTALQQKYLGKVNHNLSRMEKMIQDFLDVTLIKSGHSIPIKPCEFNLNTLIEEAIEDLVTIHGARFAFKQNSAIDVQLSKGSIRRIIENLSTNAIKYGSQNGVITISLERLDDEFILTVHNEGNPIKNEDIIFLFGEFTRTENAKNSDKAGWGLGLPLVKGLVEAHNGLINVSSDAESGTSFIIQMPMTLLCHNEYNDNSKYNP